MLGESIRFYFTITFIYFLSLKMKSLRNSVRPGHKKNYQIISSFSKLILFRDNRLSGNIIDFGTGLRNNQ